MFSAFSRSSNAAPARQETAPLQQEAEDGDAAFARSLQEQEDAELAQRMASASMARNTVGGPIFGGPMAGGPMAGGATHAQQVQMICTTCGNRSMIGVPPGTPPGATIQVQCPGCTMMNQFTSPARGGMPGAGFGGGFGMGGGAGFGGGFAPAHGSGGGGDLHRGDLVPPPMDQAESPHVACEMADRAVEMLVDTGAQSSVISMPLVRQLGLESRLDSSQQGIASGVGSARILGRLRAIPVKMGHVEFSLDFSVLGIDQPLLILGVDQMRRFRCVVDLDKQTLLFGGRDGVEVAFLPEPQSPMTYRAAGGCPTM